MEPNFLGSLLNSDLSEQNINNYNLRQNAEHNKKMLLVFSQSKEQIFICTLTHITDADREEDHRM